MTARPGLSDEYPYRPPSHPWSNDQPSEGAAATFPQLLDMETVARRLGTSIRHVRRLVTERKIPYLKIGHFIRFDERDVEVVDRSAEGHQARQRGREAGKVASRRRYQRDSSIVRPCKARARTKSAEFEGTALCVVPLRSVDRARASLEVFGSFEDGVEPQAVAEPRLEADTVVNRRLPQESGDLLGQISRLGVAYGRPIEVGQSE